MRFRTITISAALALGVQAAQAATVTRSIIYEVVETTTGSYAPDCPGGCDIAPPYALGAREVFTFSYDDALAPDTGTLSDPYVDWSFAGFGTPYPWQAHITLTFVDGLLPDVSVSARGGDEALWGDWSRLTFATGIGAWDYASSTFTPIPIPPAALLLGSALVLAGLKGRRRA